MSAYEGSKMQEADERRKELEKFLPKDELIKGGYPEEKKPQANDPKLEKQKFEEILSPLIRYGYNTALADIEQYIVSIMEQYDIDTLTIIQNKIHEMMASKKLIDSEKLSIELLKRDGWF